MEVKTDYKSTALSMLDLKIIDASFHLDEAGVKDEEINIQIKRNVEYLGENIFKIVLFATLQNADSTLNVSVSCMGVFQTSNSNQALIERNAVSIMFPYIRSYISSLTTQPGMQPIVLPPINVMALLADMEKR